MANYTLQFASDLHLDGGSSPFDLLLKPVAADLALCGDIGDPWSPIYREFIEWCSARWARVFLIAGNHEYFVGDPATWGSVDKTVVGTEMEIRRIAGRHANVHFLQESVYLIESLKIAVVGATLWTAPALRQWGSIGAGVIGDPGCRGEYTSVYKRDEYTGAVRVLHPSDITGLYLRQSQFIGRYLNSSWGGVPEGYRVIVLTHHMPTRLLNPVEFKDHPLVSCYSSSLDGLLKEPVVAWICGHSHRSRQLRMESGCLVALNPLGYRGETGKTGYRSDTTVVVYPENIAMVRNP
jgi:hypothetical protein